MQELTLAHANDFFENHLDGLLKKLTPDLRPLWGQMSPQHAIEHLSLIFRASAGKWPVPVVTPAEKLPKYRMFVYSNMAISRNFKNALMDPEKLPPLKFPDLETAIGVFWKSWAEFGEYFAQNPEAMTNHVTFGPLSGSEWRRFHFKHVVHHLAQFGVTTLEAHGLEVLPPR